MPRRSRSRSRSRSPAQKLRRRHHTHERSRESGDHDHGEQDRESRRGERDREGGSRRDRDRQRDGDRDRDRERSASPKGRDLPKGVQPLTESDYFQKSDEFRVWLKEDKRKYFDELSGDKARSYFRKFIKAWNKGKLPQKYYDGLAPGAVPASTNTSYKWSFASQPGDDDAIRAARIVVGKDNWSGDVDRKRTRDDDNDERDEGYGVSNGSDAPKGSRKVHGPTMPSSADMTLARELVESQRAEERGYKHARNKQETKERIEDLVGPKPVGREGMLEKKALKRESNRAFREKGDEGLEVDEGTLMGGGDSFRAMIARREAGKRKYEQRQEEKTSSIRERTSSMKEKDKATMDMFQQLAKQRFG